MKTHEPLFAAILVGGALAFVALSTARAADAEGFTPIFDGTSLEGWDGNPEFWRVEEGTITGQTTPEKPTPGNTFIVWRGGEVDDFELKAEYRIVGGNSGIQYRSFEVPNGKWVIGGYQADFEAGETWSGLNYGERFRGILAKRGEKAVVGENHKPTVTGSLGDPKELQGKIKKEDWNEYHVVAKGFNFKHFINGAPMSELDDEDKEQRRASGVLAMQLHAGEPMKVQFRNIRLKRLPLEAGKKKVVFVAGSPSHGRGAHEHRAGNLLLAKALNAHMGDKLLAVNYDGGWPKDPTAFDNADAIVMFSNGGGGHMVVPHLPALAPVMDRGVGLGCIHYAVEVEKMRGGKHFLAWIGGYFETNWSVNPHWEAEFTQLPDHEVARGVKPFKTNDEWYYHMRFRDNMEGVTPILTALPPAETLKRPDGAHSGNPDVRAAVLERKEPQHTMWVSERPGGKGRGFGFTGAHFHHNWGNDDFRKVVLNAITWIAGVEVPVGGVPSPTPTAEELEANQDEG